MKDDRLFKLRLRAERDQRLANASLMILCRIISERSKKPLEIDDEFPLPWSKVAQWTGRSRRQASLWISHLETCGYLKAGTLRGCPPTRRYFLVLNCVENRAIERAEKGAIDCAGNHATKCAEKGAHLISSSLREEYLMEGTPSPSQEGEDPAASPGQETGFMEPEEAKAGLASLRAALAATEGF